MAKRYIDITKEARWKDRVITEELTTNAELDCSNCKHLFSKCLNHMDSLISNVSHVVISKTNNVFNWID